MFENEDEKWQSFADLMEIMEKTTPKQPPNDFTSAVMARLTEEKEAPGNISFRQMLSVPLFENNLTIGFSDTVTKKECAFYFLLSGFFYLILSFILLLGMGLSVDWPQNGWISFQPLFGFLLAVQLALMGNALYKKGDAAVRFVRAGTLLYTCLLILNCCMGAFSVHVSMGFFFSIIFSIAGLGIAFLLGLAVDKYHPETIFSEVRG